MLPRGLLQSVSLQSFITSYNIVPGGEKMRFGMRSTWAFAAIIVVLNSSQYARGGMVDQQNFLPTSIESHFQNVQFSSAQTFTVGQAGKLLEVDVQVHKQSGTSLPLTVEVTQTTATGAPGTVLASRSINAVDVPAVDLQYLPIDFSASNLQIGVGDKLAIVLLSSEPYESSTRGYLWASSFQGADVYPGGSAWAIDFVNNPTWGDTANSPLTSQDLGFQTVVTPEPASLSILAFGGAWLLGRRARNRR
jgi:hypothetical protein